MRTQDVAVLFADIVGFTAYADGEDLTDVIGTLRQFHERMEHEVFQHGGKRSRIRARWLYGDFPAAVRLAIAMR